MILIQSSLYIALFISKLLLYNYVCVTFFAFCFPQSHFSTSSEGSKDDHPETCSHSSPNHLSIQDDITISPMIRETHISSEQIISRKFNSEQFISEKVTLGTTAKQGSYYSHQRSLIRSLSDGFLSSIHQLSPSSPPPPQPNDTSVLKLTANIPDRIHTEDVGHIHCLTGKKNEFIPRDKMETENCDNKKSASEKSLSNMHISRSNVLNWHIGNSQSEVMQRSVPGKIHHEDAHSVKLPSMLPNQLERKMGYRCLPTAITESSTASSLVEEYILHNHGRPNRMCNSEHAYYTNTGSSSGFVLYDLNKSDANGFEKSNTEQSSDSPPSITKLHHMQPASTDSMLLDLSSVTSPENNSAAENSQSAPTQPNRDQISSDSSPPVPPRCESLRSRYPTCSCNFLPQTTTNRSTDQLVYRNVSTTSTCSAPPLPPHRRKLSSKFNATSTDMSLVERYSGECSVCQLQRTLLQASQLMHTMQADPLTPKVGSSMHYFLATWQTW